MCQIGGRKMPRCPGASRNRVSVPRHVLFDEQDPSRLGRGSDSQEVDAGLRAQDAPAQHVEGDSAGGKMMENSGGSAALAACRPWPSSMLPCRGTTLNRQVTTELSVGMLSMIESLATKYPESMGPRCTTQSTGTEAPTGMTYSVLSARLSTRN